MGITVDDAQCNRNFRMLRTLAALSNAHDRLSQYLRPAGDRGSGKHDLSGRFATVLVLAGLFVPAYVVQFAYSGYPAAAGMMAVTGVLMSGSLWVYKATGSLALARDVFLGTLFGFIIWEAFYFETVFSPGSFWLVTMPVVSVLLGSPRAATLWLLMGLAALSITLLVAGEEPRINQNYRILYTISVAGMVLAIFLFVLIVDAARADAYQKLARVSAAHKELAERDELTGLFNRRALLERADAALPSYSGEGEAAILVADLDGFKDVNDTYGHQVGDRLIQHVSSMLRASCDKRGAILARIGGDEFAVLVCGVNAGEKARDLADEFFPGVATPIEIDGRTATLGISIGLAAAEVGIDTNELMRRADVAMYEAKQGGRNRLCSYQCELDESRGRRRELAKLLDQALVNHQLQVHYQPIVDSRSRKMLAVEALARWTTSAGAKIPPDEFIPVAEESGIINRLGLYVLDVACRDATAWPELRLSVNLSPVQLRSPTLVKDVLRILKSHNFPTERLELEVTEGYLIQHPERATTVLESLRSAGIRIALDDFGSGYSSVGYLRRYKFDHLKIDRSIVRGMMKDDASRSILQGVSLLAQGMSLNLTAEGVESDEEASILQLAGCSSLQGYLFGKPAPHDVIESLRFTSDDGVERLDRGVKTAQAGLR